MSGHRPTAPDLDAPTQPDPNTWRVPTTSAPEPDASWWHPQQWAGGPAEAVGPGAVIKERFLLESLLGRGGMGEVYRALDRRKQEVQDRDPYVAIKILRDDFRGHPHALIALQRETRKAQTLAHPNVVTVHDFDRDGTTVYMTMELLDGEPLSRVIAARGALPREDAVRAIRGMAAALAYAHEKGIVHSDFKPGNVFLTADGAVKVLDFGIARALPNRQRPSGDVTVFDAAELGALTPRYASPEMLRGEAPVPADDVFALGIVGYELLTGRHPFGRSTADEAQARGAKLPALPALPRRQRKALAKALAFERAARHEDAAAFLRHFDGPSPLRKTAYVGSLLLLAGAASYGWYSSVQLRPDTPWDALPPARQAAFVAAVEQGRAALAQADTAGAFALNDAFAYFDEAFAIHRNNPATIEGLRAVADGFLEALRDAPAPDREAVLGKLYCQPYLATYRPVVAACRDALGAERCSFAGLRCPRAEAP
ncbi:MAG TPA: serine/threonine-protein kinase [Gammaproteobacteria bacterium]